MEGRLAGIAGVADQKTKLAQYREVLTELLAGADVEGLKILVEHSECTPCTRTAEIHLFISHTRVFIIIRANP